MVMPGVVGPVALAPEPGFLEHPEHPSPGPASASAQNAAKARYKEGVNERSLRRRGITREGPLSSLARVTSLVTLTLVCTTGAAQANGRFPQAQAIESVPGSDGSTLFLRATFGILISRDAGKSWRWICERALGYDGAWDPPIAVTRDGRLWIGLERGLVSTIDGCTIDTDAALTGEQIKDLTVDVAGDTVWALTGAPDKRGAIWRRSAKADGGTWERMGLLPEGINPMTIEVAPSRPSRVYVTGQPYGTIRGWLWRSDDGGKTIAGAKNELAHDGPFFIAAVDPKDPNRVLLRHLHTTGSTVVVTPDAGKTFKEVLSMDSAMFGFAKSADGLTYFAGSGLPEHGLYRSTDRGEHFERVSNHGVLCLHDAPGGRLFVCENPATLGAPGIALSIDRGTTVSAIATFGDVKGPVLCDTDAGRASDAGGGLCADAWPEMRAAVLPRDAGAGRAKGDAGEGDAGGASEAVAPRRSSCGCSVVGDTEGPPDQRWLTTGLLPLVVWARARRRRGSMSYQRGPSRTR
jgi:hypothetical protein